MTALTLVAVSVLRQEWDEGGSQAGVRLLGAWHKGGKGYLGALTTPYYV